MPTLVVLGNHRMRGHNDRVGVDECAIVLGVDLRDSLPEAWMALAMGVARLTVLNGFV